MTCEKFECLVSLYLEGNLEKSELDQFVDHLARCKKCDENILQVVYFSHTSNHAGHCQGENNG
jgi:hypothetical protein